MTFSSIYFNGLTSTPNMVEVFFNEVENSIEFFIDGELINWNLNSIKFEFFSDCIELYGGEGDSQTLKINNEDFITVFKKVSKSNINTNWSFKLLNLGFKAHILISVGLIGMITLAYFFVLPTIAENAVVLIPEEYDNSLGNGVYEQYIAFSDVDTNKTKALNLFAKQLKLKNTKKLNFTVIDEAVENAFALPDGNIVIYTGLLNKMKSYDELVGLIGHEVSHINQRHSMKMMCRNLSGYIFLSVLLSDANAVIGVIGENADNLIALKFSRKFEKEADEKGLEIMTINQINPKGMSRLFERLQNDSIDFIPEFLSTHPVTKERINYLNQQIKLLSYQNSSKAKLSELFKILSTKP